MKRFSVRKYDNQKFPDMLNAIQSGKYSVKKPTGPKYISTTWEKWRMIYDEADEPVKDFYFCSLCHVIYNIKLSNSGKCLKTHAVECNGNQNQDRIDEHYAPRHRKMKKISADHRDLLTEAIVDFVVMDMRPISSVNGPGLNKMLTKMSFIGAYYGEMSEENTSELVPSRQTVHH